MTSLISIPGYGEEPQPGDFESLEKTIDHGDGIVQHFDSDGDERWFKKGKPHRDNDLPAVILTNGVLLYYQYGKLHRDNDLPAVILNNGDKYWYSRGLHHRDNDLPAVICDDGRSTYWYSRGLHHRDNDLPAIIREDGTMHWYRDGVEYHLPKR